MTRGIDRLVARRERVRESMSADKAVGVLGLLLSVAIFVYYTTWVVVAPFVDESVFSFHRLFPDRYWAIAGPTALLIAAVVFVAAFIAIIPMLKKKKSS